MNCSRPPLESALSSSSSHCRSRPVASRKRRGRHLDVAAKRPARPLQRQYLIVPQRPADVLDGRQRSDLPAGVVHHTYEQLFATPEVVEDAAHLSPGFDGDPAQHRPSSRSRHGPVRAVAAGGSPPPVGRSPFGVSWAGVRAAGATCTGIPKPSEQRARRCSDVPCLLRWSCQFGMIDRQRRSIASSSGCSRT